MEVDNEFLALSVLFDSIGIIEKGIEKIYHYLLKNKRIDNLKEVSIQYDLTLKRGYKICSVLNDLELVQIYDRPMKIHLANPVMDLWQKIINKRIESLTIQYQEKKDRTEEVLQDFINHYNLGEQVSQEYVEFINYNLHNFDDTYYSFLADNECKIAMGIRYETELISALKELALNNLPENLRIAMRNGMIKIKENLKLINIQVTFNSEVVKEILKSEEFDILATHIDTFNIDFKSIDVRVTDDNFSNFSLTDDALIQPSFDPTNKLIGTYISRNKNIYQIFFDKFNELYEKAIPINQFLSNFKDLGLNSLTDSQKFGLCLL